MLSTMLRVYLVIGLACLGAGCGDDSPSAGGAGPTSDATGDSATSGTDDGSESRETGDSSEPSDTGEVDSSPDGNGSASSTSSDSSPLCGDGIVHEGQECDDGEANSDGEPDACRTDCTLPRCGDGVVDSGEECDDGEANSDTIPNRCRLDCRAPRCGDGVRDAGEQCDLGAQNGEEGAYCDTDCQTIPELACPELGAENIAEVGEAVAGTAFGYEIDLTIFGEAGDELPLPPPCEAEMELERTAAFFVDIPVAAEYIVREVSGADPDTFTFWIVRRCGGLAVACAEDFSDDEQSEFSDAPGGTTPERQRVRSIHQEGEGVFVVVAGTSDAPATLRMRLVRGALVPDEDDI